MTLLAVPYLPQETESTCAPACLRMALAFRFPERAFAEADLASRARCRPGLGTRPVDLYRSARQCGLYPAWLPNARMETELATSIEAGAPVLAIVQLGLLPYCLPGTPFQAWHAVLVVGLTEQFVYLHDPYPPWGGEARTIDRSDFFGRWATYGGAACRL
jgi:hypothetical protein